MLHKNKAFVLKWIIVKKFRRVKFYRIIRKLVPNFRWIASGSWFKIQDKKEDLIQPERETMKDLVKNLNVIQYCFKVEKIWEIYENKG